MSRYIDADALMQKLDIKADCKECNSIDHFLCCLRSRDFVNACEAINDAPSIEIVRCKECKHEPICSHSVQHTTHEPTTVTIGYKSVDFCSYGCRKEE